MINIGFLCINKYFSVSLKLSEKFIYIYSFVQLVFQNLGFLDTSVDFSEIRLGTLADFQNHLNRKFS